MLDDFKLLWAFLSQLSAPVLASLLSGFLVLLRIVYTNEEKRWVRRMLEGTICTMLTFAAAHLAIAFGMNESVSYAIGAYIGWYGADETARIAKSKVKKSLNEED